MMPGALYKLDDNGRPYAVHDIIAWGEWFETSRTERCVARTILGTKPPIQISTVFLGVDHSFMSDTPVLWETMVFGGPMDQAMHAAVVAEVKATIK